MRKLLFFLLLFALSQRVSAQFAMSEEGLAYQYYQQGEFEKASVLFEKLFTSSGEREGFFDYYFTSLLKIKNYTEAEKVARKMIKKQPNNGLYTIALGRVYLESGKKPAADKAFNAAIANIPLDEFKIREMANAFYKLEAYDMAIDVFLKGRKLFVNDRLFTFDLLSIYRFKKDKELLVQEYITALSYMPEILFQAQNSIISVFEDNNDYLVLQGILLKKIQKEPDNEVFTELLTWSYLQQKEYEMALRQLIAQDKRTKNKSQQLFNAANTFITNQAYPTAIKTYEYLIAKGKESDYFLPARLELINTNYLLATSEKFTQSEISALANDYDNLLKEFGKSSKTVFAIKKWANLQTYYLNEPKKGEAALEEALKLTGLNLAEIGQIKLDLGDIYVLTGQPWEAVLLYEQVAKQFENSPVGNDANYKTARLSFYQGNFEYSKSQADVLKGSTSQLIANDALNLSLLISDNLQNKNDSLALKMYADAEMLQFRNKIQPALVKLDSIAIMYAGNSLEDDILLSKSKIYIKTADFNNAALALTKLFENFKESIWADDAIFTLAELYENKLKQPDKAKILYQKLITDYAGSLYIAEARKRFRNMRGDAL